MAFQPRYTPPKTHADQPPRENEAERGGQAGHTGQTRTFTSEPDVIETHRPRACQQCQTPLDTDIVARARGARQVRDLPTFHVVTTEHQVETVVCPCCGAATRGAFPAAVTHPVQYGAHMKRLAVYLHTEQFIPYARTRQLLADLFTLPLSTGSLQNFITTAAVRVPPITAAIKVAVTQAAVGHADETGFSITGQRYWVHTVSTPALTYYEPHARRGQHATNAIGILPHFTGTLVHDAWATYFTYHGFAHARCNAHHLRDLTAIVDNDQQQWAALMRTFLGAAKHLVTEAQQTGATALAPDTVARMHQLYDTIVGIGLAENPFPRSHSPPGTRGRRKKTKARNLAIRSAQNGYLAVYP